MKLEEKKQEETRRNRKTGEKKTQQFKETG